MVWDKDFDVKEYHPKKKHRSSENQTQFPRGADAELQEYIRSEGLEDRAGGVMMTTAEILDFSEGSDSY
jgi:predicted house-cleaning NTP pyrophosphatase (Maf/HAM1 superfamily)